MTKTTRKRRKQNNASISNGYKRVVKNNTRKISCDDENAIKLFHSKKTENKCATQIELKSMPTEIVSKKMK